MINTKRFKDFEPPQATNASGSWPLDDWYNRVREIPIRDLTAGDLATAIRQGVWLEESLPAALTILETDLWAGDLYEGELLAALRFIPREWWHTNHTWVTTVKSLISKARNSDEWDEDLDGQLLEIEKLLP